jgi:AraC-like DNA-binding protein
LHEAARAYVARCYARPLTLAGLARALATSPRVLQRAYEQAGAGGFSEDLRARRMEAAATLLAEQPSIAVRDVARLVGYRTGAHFARAFGREYGVVPSQFRLRARRARSSGG